jgi:hypothetical protein
MYAFGLIQLANRPLMRQCRMTGTHPLIPASRPRRIFKSLVAIPLALWVFLEEWVWDSVLAFTRWLGKLPPIHWLETQVAKLPPYAALIVFVVPAVILFPFKLAALWLIAHGHKMYGIWVFIIAKIIGTAFLARIFSLTKPALMTIGWFNKTYNAIDGWKQRLYAYVRALPSYQRIKAWSKEFKTAVKTWWRETSSRKN